MEDVALKYVDLCVDLKKGRYAKDGLIHYRNLCQQINVASLETVVTHFLDSASARADAAPRPRTRPPPPTWPPWTTWTRTPRPRP